MMGEDGLIRRKKKLRGGPVKKVTVPKKTNHRQLRTHVLYEGLPPLPNLMGEILDMTDVLLGRTESPFENGILTLMETADAYFARASEIQILLHEAEREGTVMKGDHYYKFRTGELRTFLDMCKRSEELGSRRITAASLQFEMERTGKESKGGGYFHTEED